MSYKIIAVVGPTAVGKSDVGVKLAQLFNGEIINGDSIQVYKELNIGSAKVTEAEMHGIPHHLLDYKNIGDDYSVQHFQKDARAAIEDIISRGKLPIIVGGTGLYIKALLYDYSFTKMETELNDYAGVPTEELYERLQQLDPKATEVIHPHNRRRVIRALQMAESGNLKSEQEAGQKHEQIYDAMIIGLTMDRTALKDRINRRVDMMFENGLLAEATQLNEKYDWNMHGLHGIGYREFRDYFLGNMTLDEVREQIKTHTRQFAKRQYTWWNNQMPVRWYDITDDEYFNNMVSDIWGWLNEETD